MGQQQRQRVWPAPGRVDQVHRDPADLSAQVSEPVKTGLQPQRVESPPAGDNARQPAAGHAALPCAVISRWQPGRVQPPGKVGQGRAVEFRPEGLRAGITGCHSAIIARVQIQECFRLAATQPGQALGQRPAPGWSPSSGSLHVTLLDFGVIPPRATVMRFQASQGLSADGAAGSQTWPALVLAVSPGSTGDGVRAVQSELNANGYHLAVDGVYGPLTLAAVHGFPARYDLAGALGEIDPATWNALMDPAGRLAQHHQDPRP